MIKSVLSFLLFGSIFFIVGYAEETTKDQLTLAKDAYIKRKVEKINKTFTDDAEKKIYIEYLNNIKPFSMEIFLSEYSGIASNLKELPDSVNDERKIYEESVVKAQCIIFLLLRKNNFNISAMIKYMDVFGVEFSYISCQLFSKNEALFKASVQQKYEFYEKVLTKFLSYDTRIWSYIGIAPGTLMQSAKVAEKLKALDLKRFEDSTKRILERQIIKSEILDHVAPSLYYHLYPQESENMDKLQEMLQIGGEINVGFMFLEPKDENAYKYLVEYKKRRLENYLQKKGDTEPTK